MNSCKDIVVFEDIVVENKFTSIFTMRLVFTPKNNFNKDGMMIWEGGMFDHHRAALVVRDRGEEVLICIKSIQSGVDSVTRFVEVAPCMPYALINMR